MTVGLPPCVLTLRAAQMSTATPRHLNAPPLVVAPLAQTTSDPAPRLVAAQPTPTSTTTAAMLLCAAVAGAVVAAVFALVGTDDGPGTASLASAALVTAFVTAAFCRRAGLAAATVAATGCVLAATGELLETRLGADGYATHLQRWAGPLLAIVIIMVVRSSTAVLRRTRVLAFTAITLLLLPTLPGIGMSVNGAAGWITVAGVQVSPIEPARVAVLLAVSAIVWRTSEKLALVGSELRRRLPDARTLASALVLPGLAVIAHVADRDLGPAAVLVATTALLIHVSTGRSRYSVAALLCLLFAAGAACAAMPYTRARFTDLVASAPGGQLANARGAAWWGGLTGHGLGSANLMRSPGRIPVAASDYALPALQADLGAVAAGIVLATLLALLLAAASLARKAIGGPAQHAAVAITAMLALQSFAVTAGSYGLVPLTGMTVPLFSRGGSSAVSTWAALALLVASTPHPQRLRALDLTLPAATVNRAVCRGQILIAAALVVVALAATAVPYGAFGATRDGRAAREWAQATRRGPIISSDGLLLATTVNADSLESARRLYPSGSLAAGVVGTAPAMGAATGLERSWAGALTCANLGVPARLRPDQAWPLRQQDLRRCRQGGLLLTINSELQRAAVRSLGHRQGVVAVMDSENGDVLALAASPVSDPNPTVSGSINSGLHAAAERAGKDDGMAWTHRTAPGSVAKLVTAAAALGAHVDVSTPVRSVLKLDSGATVHNSSGACGSAGSDGLARALATSCNSALAEIALRTGMARMADAAARTGVTTTRAISGIPVDPTVGFDAPQTPFLTALAGIGQGQVAVSPAALLGLGGATVQGGRRTQPRLVSAVCRNDATVVSVTVVSTQAISNSDARQLHTGMVAAVATGTATRLQELTANGVAAKTGTAQDGHGRTRAWLLATLRSGRHDYVLVVLVHPGQVRPQPTGGHDAADVALPVLRQLAAMRQTPDRNCANSSVSKPRS